MWLFVLCIVCALQAADDPSVCADPIEMAKWRVRFLFSLSDESENSEPLILMEDDSQVTFPSFASGVDDKEVNDTKRAMHVLLSPSDVPYNPEDYQKLLPSFQSEVVPFDDIVIKVGKRLAKKDLNQLLEDKEVARLSAEIYDKMQQDRPLIAAFSVAFNLARKDEDNTLLEQRTQAWKNFRLCGARTLLDLKQEQMPEIQNPTLKLSAIDIEQFFELNKEIVLTEEQQKLYSAYYAMTFAMRQIHRMVDQKTYSLLHPDITE